MSSAAQLARLGTSDLVAERLLKSSTKNSYDPVVDVDWEAPHVDGLYWVPPHRSSLYGTALWEEMSEEQRIELTRHELGSWMSIGMWFELIVMQMLLRENYNSDPQSSHMQFVLSEVGDETRHSTMFGKLLNSLGVPSYRPSPLIMELARIFKSISGGAASYASILVAEEITDRLQRELINDDRVQPLARQLAKIHVTEEARHVSFARAETVKLMAGLNPVQRAAQQAACALVSYEVVIQLTRPELYAAVGLDPARAYKAMRTNPCFQETMRYSGERIMPFLQDAGIIGGPGMALWHKSFLIPEPRRSFPRSAVPRRVSAPVAQTAAWTAGIAGLAGGLGKMAGQSVGHAVTNGRIAPPS